MSMSFLFGAIGFVVAIGVLIAFHEFGHYWVARRFGVKVLRFSIGFGKPLYRRIAGADRTEYVVGMLPLGGYVKMLDEREGEVAPAQASRAFNNQPLHARAAIVAAGPAANLLLAFLLYFVIAVSGVYEVRPLVGGVTADSAAMRAGLVADDEIVAVAGRDVRGWKDVVLTLLDVSLDADTRVPLEVANAGERRRLVLDLAGQDMYDVETSLLDRLGITPQAPVLPAVIGELTPSGSARRSGVEVGDRIVAFDGRDVSSWRGLVEDIRARPGRTVPVVVERNGALLSLSLAIDEVAGGGEAVGRIGAAPEVSPESLQRYRVLVRYGPLAAVAHAFSETVAMSWLTLKFIARMLTGSVSFEHISGPLTIAEFTGASFLMGFVTYLTTMALLSISIGILNLLPIPVLDGGHLLYYLIEWIKGSPLSRRAEAYAQIIGIALLGMLFLLAIYNDLNRLLPSNF